MKKSISIYIFYITLLILPSYIFSQISEEMWVNYYDYNKQYDRFKSVKQTADSNFICIGSSFEDLWLVKVDKDGDTIWSRTYKPNESITRGSDVLEVGDDYYCIGTYDDDIQNGYAVLIVKYNSSGELLWEKRIKNKNENILESINYTSTIVNTYDSNLVILAHSIKFTVSGSTSIQDIWLLKLNLEGDTLWTKNYDLGFQYREQTYSIITTSDSGFAIVGTMQTPFTSPWEDLFILKVDKNGTKQWHKIYGGAGYDVGADIEQTSDGGFIVVGRYAHNFDTENNADLWLLKTDEHGDTLWTKTYGGEKAEWGNSIEITADNGFIMTGMTETYGPGFWDVWVVRTDSLGDKLWTKTFGDSTIDVGYSINKTFDNGYVIGGYGGSYVSYTYDGYLIRLGPEKPVSIEKENNLPNEYRLYQNYPNPFNPSTTVGYTIPTTGFVQLKVYNTLGQVVSTLINEHQISGKFSIQFNANYLPSGVYFYKLHAGEFSSVKKMILIK